MVQALPTREDLFQVGAREILARSALRPEGQRISREAVFTAGEDINILIAAASAMGDETIRRLAQRWAALYLDSAENEDLDRLVADRFSREIVRKQPQASVVLVTFRRGIPPSSGAAVTIDAGKKVRAGGVTFELLEPAAFGVNARGPVRALAQCGSAGTVGNVAIGAIGELVDPPDVGITVTNEEPASGGTNQESDGALRERARAFWRASRRGVLEAIQAGAEATPGVVHATAVELLDAEGVPSGPVLCYVADSNGQSNSQLLEAVRLKLKDYRAAGVYVRVVGSAPRFEPVAYQIQFEPGVDTREKAQALKALTVSVVNLLQPGEPLQRSMLMSLARSISGAIVPDTAVQVPAGDVVPAAGESIKTDLSLVTVNGI